MLKEVINKPFNKLVVKLNDVNQIDDDKAILEGDDDELKELAQDEMLELETEKIELEEKLKVLLLPKDPNDDKNLILEIRAGTGGDEAALFAGNLYRMYLRFAERNSWNSELLSINDNEGGGVKEVIVSLNNYD